MPRLRAAFFPLIPSTEMSTQNGFSMTDQKAMLSVRTVWWEEDGQNVAVCLLDQSLLPQQVSYLKLRHEQEIAAAITSLKVRGAPAIGVTTAFGIALAIHRLWQGQEEALTLSEAQEHLNSVSESFRSTRPTAVNLFWAIERMQQCARHAIHLHCSLQYLVHQLREEAQAIAQEDFAACMQMGMYGAELISDGDTLLTHCNAGALATAGWGTALASIYVAHKIGTFSLAVLAYVHHIPFYVVAPRSSVDLKLSSGEQIAIEQRNPEEVTNIHGVVIAPPGVHVANPAFDVTPHRYVTAIITEMGIARPPYEVALRRSLCSERTA